MIHEEICTYEVSLLAKEKGFPLQKVIKQDGRAFFYELPQSHPDWANCDAWYLPTQSLLQRWLREEKGIEISILPNKLKTYAYCVCNVRNPIDPFLRVKQGYDTYELALENALKYALDNMIEEVKVAAVLNANRRLAEIPKLDYAISAKADYDNGLTTGFVDGSEWGYNKAIANVCGWLKANAHFCVSEFTGTLDKDMLVKMIKEEMARKSEKNEG